MYGKHQTKNEEFLVGYQPNFMQVRQVVLVGELVRHCVIS